MLRKIMSVVSMAAVLLLMTVPALALEPGVYTGYMETSYYNPDTGAIDDGGTKNASLGEGMCRSATDEACLVEVDANGKMWVTARLLLQSSCSGVRLATRTGNNSYSWANLTITAENSGNDSVDYRFPVSDPEGWLKGTMYVTPMGRDVLWYLRVRPGSLTPGSGDFQVQIDLNAAEAAKAAKNNKPAANADSSGSSSAGSASAGSSGSASASNSGSNVSAGSGSGSAPAANSGGSSAGSERNIVTWDSGSSDTPSQENSTQEAADDTPTPDSTETAVPEETGAADTAAVDENHDGVISEEEAAKAEEAAEETASADNTGAASAKERKSLLIDDPDEDVQADLSTLWLVLGCIVGVFGAAGVVAWLLRDKWFYLVEDWAIFGGNRRKKGGRGKK